MIVKKPFIRYLHLSLVIMMVLCACAKQPEALTWQKQYDLGLRYLSEGNYQEAIIAFTASIEIAPNTESYLALADAYIAIGDIDKAIQILEEASKVLIDQKDVLENRLQQISSNRLQLQNVRIIDSQYADVCMQALSMYNSNHIQELVTFIRQNLIVPIRENASQNSENYTFYFGNIRGGFPEGVGIYIYSKKVKECTEAYIGELSLGLRSGLGVALFTNTYSQGYYAGGWKEDSTNGDGAMYEDAFGYGEYGDSPDGVYDYYSIGTTKMGVAEGYWLDGRYENGKIPIEDDEDEGTTIAGYQFYFVDGKLTPMGRISAYTWWHWNGGYYENDADGGYLMAKGYIVYKDGTEVFEEAPHEFAGLPCRVCDKLRAEGEAVVGFHAWESNGEFNRGFYVE